MEARRLRFTMGIALVGLAGLTAACGSDDSSPVKVGEDERGSVGVPPPAVEYCTKSGYVIQGSRCVFPDDTSCEEWSFYYATCGQPHSYCAAHGGQITSKTEDRGTYTAVQAYCSLNGVECTEDSFFRTGKCQ